MDYKQIAQDIINNVGGKENIKNMTHCFTRLRFVLKDSKKAEKAVVERLEGVIQVVIAGGQFQVVLGSKVTKVYDQAVALLGGEVGSESEVDVPEEKQSLGATLLQKIGEIFTPIVPAIAGAMGGAIMGIGGASNHGFANNGILTIPAYQCPSNTGQFVAFLIGIAVAFFGAAILTYIVGFDDDPMPGSEKKSAPAVAAPVAAGDVTVSSPVAGKAVALTEVKDDVFASESMGKGMGVVPTSGEIVAPADCTVDLIADTKHAVGLTLDNGVELLIHIGIDTVKMNGEGFTQHVQAGTHVTKGTKLVSFDTAKITAAGYDTTVMVIVSNTDDYSDVKADVANATLTVVR